MSIIIVTGALGLDLDVIRESKFEIRRHGNADLVREYFRTFDDDPYLKAEYILLYGRAEADHLVNPERLNRALWHLVKAQGGYVYFPRKTWQRRCGAVSVQVYDTGTALVAGS